MNYNFQTGEDWLEEEDEYFVSSLRRRLAEEQFGK